MLPPTQELFATFEGNSRLPLSRGDDAAQASSVGMHDLAHLINNTEGRGCSGGRTEGKEAGGSCKLLCYCRVIF